MAFFPHHWEQCCSPYSFIFFVHSCGNFIIFPLCSEEQPVVEDIPFHIHTSRYWSQACCYDRGLCLAVWLCKSNDQMCWLLSSHRHIYFWHHILVLSMEHRKLFSNRLLFHICKTVQTGLWHWLFPYLLSLWCALRPGADYLHLVKQDVAQLRPLEVLAETPSCGWEIVSPNAGCLATIVNLLGPILNSFFFFPSPLHSTRSPSLLITPPFSLVFRPIGWKSSSASYLFLHTSIWLCPNLPALEFIQFFRNPAFFPHPHIVFIFNVSFVLCKSSNGTFYCNFMRLMYWIAKGYY